jgi:ActR/RegA family two-component response regulator
MPQPIAQSITNHDLSSRFQSTQTVGASPTDNAETIIGTLTLAGFGDIPVVNGIRLHGWAAFTVGTSGTAVNLRIRQTNASGSVVAATGATSVTAANLGALDVIGKDAAPGVIVYVLTMQVTGGAAASTVSALHLGAIVI